MKATGARHSLNMISAVTAQGLLRFSTYTGSLTGARFIEFCRKLMTDTDRPVYLVVDGHPTHRSKLVKEFVASTEGKLRLLVLPAYSPQLNPDEWVWKNVKHDRVGRTSVTGPDDFKTKVIGALRRLQKLPHIVRAFFVDPDLATSPRDQGPLTNLNSLISGVLGKCVHPGRIGGAFGTVTAGFGSPRKVNGPWRRLGDSTRPGVPRPGGKEDPHAGLPSAGRGGGGRLAPCGADCPSAAARPYPAWP